MKLVQPNFVNQRNSVAISYKKLVKRLFGGQYGKYRLIDVYPARLATAPTTAVYTDLLPEDANVMRVKYTEDV